ncbi:hypothetical protein HCN44_000096 [Aphidius gifuensis]|uniref:Uncharacterized protein n=1 Tax=Aphidius gifuensis TaxID=684658 RepID=A0A834XQG5_APHGI|nr:uncharacterized protein LOC122855335 [Aphidius gifuensis]KAF7990291.1 hypothetical protein HCN44_000096 [Aphidius gifuensis]
MWKSLFLCLFITTALDALPLDKESYEEVPIPPTELLPPLADAEESKFAVDIFNENVTLANELLPPFENNKTDKLGVVYIINLYAVRNATEDNDNDEEVLNADITGKIPGILEPIATVLLILEEEDENKPVSLDEFAKDLEDDGFKVERIGDDNEIKVIKIDMDGTEEPDFELIKPGQLNKIRRRRSPEPHLGLLNKLLDKHRGDDCDPCRQKQYYQQPPQYYQPPPQQYQPPPQYYQPPRQHYQPPPQHYQPPQYEPYRQHYRPPPQQQPCDVCGQTGGNHGSHSQSSAQASAQSSSNSW